MKKIIKRISSVLCIIVLFIICNKLSRYILVDDISSYTRLTMHQLYNSNENIDIAFVGSSHVYRSFIPEITDNGFGAHTFNCGTSLQPMDGSLAMVRELIADNDVSCIYLEMYYAIATEPSYKDRTKLTSTYIISDYMKPSLRKYFYILQASSKEYWITSLIPARRYWEKFFDADYIKNIILKKNEESYKNYEWIRTEEQMEYYVDRGFVANDNIVPEETYWNLSAYDPIDIESISMDWKNSLQDIIQLCKKEGVKLILFVTPMPEWTIVGKGNYDEYHLLIEKIANNAGIDFYDFNFVDSKYFATTENGFFMDENHLNTFGAEAFSKLFCDFFSGIISEEELFFGSLSEKLANEQPIVYGVAGVKEDYDNGVNRARIITNKAKEMEFRITMVTSEGDEKIIQDFSGNTDIELPMNVSGVLTIAWRMKGSLKVNTFELEYQIEK